MKKLILKALMVAAVMGCSTVVYAKSIKIGTGSVTGNYFSMMEDIASADYCGSIVNMELINTSGSVENADNLMNKRAAAGVIQMDVLKFKAKQNPGKFNDRRIKIIHQLHVESLHLLIPINYKPKSTSSGFMKLFSKFTKDKPIKLDINTLKNQQVASTGGSVVSGQALSLFLGLNLKIIDTQGKNFPKNMPILLVSGQPDSTVEALLATGKYVLAELDDRLISKQAPFYVPITLNYKVGAKMQAVPSIGVQALLVGKSSRKASRNVRMSKLATCISTSLEDLADDPDTNPNWESVYEKSQDRVNLDWDEFPLIESNEG